jgi:hypothetical protein
MLTTKYLTFLSYTAHMLKFCYRMRRVPAYNLQPHVQGKLTVCYRMHRVRLQFTTACTRYIYNSLPHTQGTLTIHYCIRRIHLQFITDYAGYPNKTNHTQILPFQQIKLKHMKKSEKSKKLFLTHSSGPQSNLKQLFLC